MNVWCLLECWCDDEGYVIAGIFDSQEKAFLAKSQDGDRLRLMTVKRFRINVLIPENVRDTMLSYQED